MKVLALCFLLHLFSAVYTSHQSQWDLYLLPNSESQGTLCLDGSPGGYYYRPGLPDKWVIHIQGGGWCYNETQCVDRAKGILGSSKSWPQHLPSDFVDETGGIVSPDANVNPDFYNWSMAWIAYCDGASFSGEVAQPVVVGNTKLYFRGKRILDAAFDELLKNRGLSSAKEIIITGTSAGGLATYMHIDYLASKLSFARVVGVPDAGYFMDIPDVKGVQWIREQYRYVFNMQNVSGGVDQNCIAAKDKSMQWQCFFAAYTYPYVKTPLFVINSLYDTWQLGNIVAPPDDGIDWSACLSGKQCNSQQLDTFQQFRNSMLQSFKEQDVSSKQGNGLFALSCFIHALTVDNWYWTTPKVNDKTMRQAFSDWYYKRGGSYFNIDCAWPCNPVCKST